jgi:hypothetical protein
LSDTFRRCRKLSLPVIELQPSDHRIKSSFVEIRVIHAGGGGALHSVSTQRMPLAGPDWFAGSYTEFTYRVRKAAEDGRKRP